MIEYSSSCGVAVNGIERQSRWRDRDDLPFQNGVGTLARFHLVGREFLDFLGQGVGKLEFHVAMEVARRKDGDGDAVDVLAVDRTPMPAGIRIGLLVSACAQRQENREGAKDAKKMGSGFALHPSRLRG